MTLPNAAFIVPIIFSITIFLAVGYLLSNLTPSKSRRYRKYLADMYIGSKIRALAKEEALDIVAESESFKKWSKKEKLDYYDCDLDNTIEMELKDKISDTKPTTSKKE